MVTSNRILLLVSGILLPFASCKKDLPISIEYKQDGLYFEFHAHGGGEEIICWRWDFGAPGDDDVSSDQDPKYTYKSAGTYNVKLRAITRGGADQVSTTVSICASTMEVTYVVNCSTVTFTLPEYARGVNFSFGDETSISGVNGIVTHVYSGAAIYDVIARMETPGCSQTAVWRDSVSVLIQPTAEFKYSIRGLTVGFLNLTTGSAPGWHWEFGDGTTSNEKHPSHRYAQPGTYSVTLTTGTDQCNTASTTTHVVDVPVPNPEFMEDYLPEGIMGAPFRILVPPYQYINNSKIVSIRGDDLPIYSPAYSAELRIDTIPLNHRISWDVNTSDDYVTIVISKDRFKFGSGQILNPESIVWAWKSGMGGQMGNIRYDDGRPVAGGAIQENSNPQPLETGRVYYILIFSKDANGGLNGASHELPVFTQP